MERGIKVLVVEDDVYFQRVLLKRLQLDGHEVLTATDGREGMKAIVSFSPELVISDWMMPHVDGLELCQAMKTALKEDAPYFILLTARGEISDKLLALDTGADDYLVKPCDQGELMARVRAAVRNIVLSQELRRAVKELRSANMEMTGARAELLSLLADLPACPQCRRVRTPEGDWEELGAYLARRLGVELGTDRCPECEPGRPARQGNGSLAA
jgi:DNA-binding response OmpR family regulator